jgi:formylglycine-generating enzyme required for sulfatase activity
MVVIPYGRFLMGSPPSEPSRDSDEHQHEVAIAPFAIGKYEITFEEYDRFVKATNHPIPVGSGWGSGKLPIQGVTWFDAMDYAKWLSKQTGQLYSLPTEAEWEYATRAGTITPFHFGNTISTSQAIYNNNKIPEKTFEVGQFPANAWGLHDVHGSVLEWTCSAYDAMYRGNELKCVNNLDSDNFGVLRGGIWMASPDWLRSAKRFKQSSNWIVGAGFRLARTLPP